MTKESPLLTIIIPKVAINGGSLSLATQAPLTQPHRAPVARPAKMPRGIGSFQKLITTPAMTEQRVMTVPTERSIPPVTITNDTPTARMPLTAVESKIPTILLKRAKLGDAKEKPINSTIRLAKASSFWVASDRNNEALSVISISAAADLGCIALPPFHLSVEQYSPVWLHIARSALGLLQPLSFPL